MVPQVLGCYRRLGVRVNHSSYRRKLLDGLVTSLALMPIRLATKLLNSLKATLTSCLTQPEPQA